jgi:hypothetical protein
MKQYVVDRLKEASTWRGFVYLLTAFGVTVAPATAEAIIAAGMAIAGVIGAVFPG